MDDKIKELVLREVEKAWMAGSVSTATILKNSLMKACDVKEMQMGVGQGVLTKIDICFIIDGIITLGPQPDGSAAEVIRKGPPA